MLKENYNIIERYLHYFILNNQYVSDLLFDLEKKIFLNNVDLINQKHLFISGLARSGSTLLLNILYQDNKFCSLTYNDMPMILAPNLWSKYFRKKNKNLELKKRAHGDLIDININSPEAFEEVFWKHILKKNYLTTNSILDKEISKENILEYSKFISLVCNRYEKKNYLSKNNNSIFRINYILNHFAKSFFIIPFRDPLSHSYSLLNQHLKFKDLQNQNKFIKDYMNWLGHYEFGLNHKTFDFKDKSLKLDLKSDSINYWLQIWINYYEYILKIYNQSNNQNRIILFNYNKLCDDNNKYLDKFFYKIKIDNYNNKIKINFNSKKNLIAYDNHKLENAKDIYEKLKLKNF